MLTERKRERERESLESPPLASKLYESQVSLELDNLKSEKRHWISMAQGNEI